MQVIFYGAETGVVEAVVHASRGYPEATSGLEDSTINGEGVGISPFLNPNRGKDVTVGLESRIPQEAVERIARSRQIAATVLSDDEADSDASVSGSPRSQCFCFQK